MSHLSYTGSKGSHVDALLPFLGDGDALVSPMVGGGALEVAAAGRFSRLILGDASTFPLAVLRGCVKDPRVLIEWKEKIRGELYGLHPNCPDNAECDPTSKPRRKHCKVFRRLQRQISELALNSPGDVDPVYLGGAIVGLISASFSQSWRANKGGRLNACMDPRGTRQVLSLEGAERYHESLRNADITQATWDQTLLKAYGLIMTGERVVVYVDPPYLGDSTTGVYYGRGWRRAQAVELATALGRLPCKVVVSEQTPGGAELYAELMGGAIHLIEERARNPVGGKAGKVREDVVIVKEARA